MRGLPSSEAYALLYGLTIDPRSHVYAGLAGQMFQGSQADFALVMLAEAVLNIGAEKGKPIRLPHAYTGAAKKRERAAQVAPVEKQRLTVVLETYSSIPD